jgi:hypothetical protein
VKIQSENLNSLSLPDQVCAINKVTLVDSPNWRRFRSVNVYLIQVAHMLELVHVQRQSSGLTWSLHYDAFWTI